MELLEHVIDSIEKATNNESNLANEIINMQNDNGTMSLTGLHLLNNLCKRDDTRFLQVGCWNGINLCSAICANKIKCFLIDNFIDTSDIDKDKFNSNLNYVKENLSESTDIFLMQKDFKNIKQSCIGRYNIFLLNLALINDLGLLNLISNFLVCLDKTFILIINNLTNSLRESVANEINNNNIEILHEYEFDLTKLYLLKKPLTNDELKLIEDSIEQN